MPTKTRAELVAEFHAIMANDRGGTPSTDQCRAVIEDRAAVLPEGPELWALWHQEGDAATLCEFDGSVCFEAYNMKGVADRAAASLNNDAFSKSGSYIVARIPAGIAACPAGARVRAGGREIKWQAGMEDGFTFCRAKVSDLIAAEA